MNPNETEHDDGRNEIARNKAHAATALSHTRRSGNACRGQMPAPRCPNFVTAVGEEFDPNPQDNVFDSLFKQYERVIVQSVITSFGLDAFIKDRHGGDVDTIHNVRSGVEYKNEANQAAYENRGEYDSHQYHTHEKYRATNKHFSEQRKAGKLDDAYTGERFKRNESHDLDHTISANEIHNDPGRVLSGLSGTDLANSPENLNPTNRNTNRSKKADTMEDFLERRESRGDGYSDEEKDRMREADQKARDEYNRKINTTYYTSPAFWQDSALAATKTGVQMGLRQTLGFVMTEVWFAVKDALADAADDFGEKLKAIANGIKLGFARAKEKFRELLSKFGEGAISGLLSSLATTLINTFLTTAKNVVRIIRQAWASIVEAAKILIFNPDNLPFAERMKAALKIIATGASVVLGSLVQEAVHTALLPHVGAIPALGGVILDVVSMLAGSLCTGFLTVSLLYLIDNNPFGRILQQIDKSIADYKLLAKQFVAYAKKRMIDLLSMFYQSALEAARGAELSRKQLARVRKIEAAVRKRIEREQAQLDEFIRHEIPQLQKETRQLLDIVNRPDSDSDTLAATINHYATLLGKQLQFQTQAEFNEFMDSDRPLVL